MNKELKLTDREWREFKFKDVFHIVDGYYNKKPPMEENGTLPFLGATQYNNGITGMTTKASVRIHDKVGGNSMNDVDKRFYAGGCIAITNNGSVGHAYYQASEFTCSHDITVVYLKDQVMAKELATFLIPSIQKAGESFAYAKKWRPIRMRHSKLMLPIQANGMPDWAFMEAYMKQEEERLIEATREKLEKQLLENIIVLGALKDREWREFVFGDVFDIQATSSGIDKKKLFGGVGNVPYLTRTDNNNGIDGFVEPQGASSLDEGNVITIGLDTQTVFYQESSFYTGQNIQVVRHKKLDKHNALFIIRAIKILVQKFSWGSNGATLTRLRRGKLFLPIQSDGTPDWKFMSAFMQQVEQETLGKALQFFKSECKEMQNGGGGVKCNPILLKTSYSLLMACA